MADDPIALRSLLGQSARRWGMDNPAALGTVFGNWRGLVGDRVANRCTPAGLARGVLKVWAENPAWAKELRYLAPEMIRGVNTGVGAEVVKEIKVVLRPPGVPPPGPRTPPPQPVSPTARSRPARPSGASLDADRLVAGIADDRLATATKRALLAAQGRSGSRH